MTARLTILAAVVVVAQTMLAAFGHPRVLLAAVPLNTLPARIDGWRNAGDLPIDVPMQGVQKPADYVSRRYSRGGRDADLLVEYYAAQTQGDSIHSPLNCLPGAGWTPSSLARTTIETPAGPVRANRDVVENGLDRRLVIYWYQSHGRTVASEYASKAYLVLDGMRLHRTDAALVRIVTRIRSDEGAAESEAADFVRTLYPVLNAYLPG